MVSIAITRLFILEPRRMNSFHNYPSSPQVSASFRLQFTLLRQPTQSIRDCPAYQEISETSSANATNLPGA